MVSSISQMIEFNYSGSLMCPFQKFINNGEFALFMGDNSTLTRYFYAARLLLARNICSFSETPLIVLPCYRVEEFCKIICVIHWLMQHSQHILCENKTWLGIHSQRLLIKFIPCAEYKSITIPSFLNIGVFMR